MKKKKFTIEAPEGVDKVLLHTCCAPCSSAIIECLMQHGIRPTIYYCNPNIYPLEEYLIRKDECTRYAQSLGLDIVDADYDHEGWLGQIHGLEQEPERGGRCLKCFKIRLKDTARYAHEHGFRVITTTLASSRWKSLDQINEAGHFACDAYPDVIWWEQNWRKGGLSERRIAIIKEYDFYNQQYCGCEFSMRHLERAAEKESESTKGTVGTSETTMPDATGKANTSEGVETVVAPVAVDIVGTTVEADAVGTPSVSEAVETTGTLGSCAFCGATIFQEKQSEEK